MLSPVALVPVGTKPLESNLATDWNSPRSTQGVLAEDLCVPMDLVVAMDLNNANRTWRSRNTRKNSYH